MAEICHYLLFIACVMFIWKVVMINLPDLIQRQQFDLQQRKRSGLPSTMVLTATPAIISMITHTRV